MTDLITKLSEDLHALIQSSPRSPTKEEIAAILRNGQTDQQFNAMGTLRIAMDAGMLGGYPDSMTNVPNEIRRRSKKSPLPCEFGHWPDHEHHWTLNGYDVNGLLCQAGSALDVSNGKHWTCLNTCGASKLK